MGQLRQFWWSRMANLDSFDDRDPPRIIENLKQSLTYYF